MNPFTKAVLAAASMVAMAFADSSYSPTEKMGVGARLGLGYSFIWGLADDWNQGDDEDAPAGIMFEGGVQGRYILNKTFQFTPELLFSYAKLTQEDDGYDREFTQMDLTLPLMFQAKLHDRAFASIGVVPGISVSNKVELNASVNGLASSNHKVPETIEQAAFNFGVMIGGGYYVIKNLSVDLRAYMGVLELYPDAESLLIDISGARLLTLKLGVNYWVF